MTQSPISPLWPTNYTGVEGDTCSPLPLIFATGAYGTGKSLFGYLIKPGPRTLAFDFENGSASHAFQLGAHRINFNLFLNRLFGVGRWTAYDVWTTWRRIVFGDYRLKAQPLPADHVAQWEAFITLAMEDRKPDEVNDPLRTSPFPGLPAHQYDVVLVDTIAMIEEGLVEWVKKHGPNLNQYAKMQGIMWSDVKKELSTVMNTLMSLVQTVYAVAHLRQCYENDKPVKGKFEPRGKDTFKQLASLTLWFYRDTHATIQVDGQTVKLCPHYPRPSAHIEKNRFNWVDVSTLDENGDPTVKEIFPRRLPCATPGAIRRYMAQPVPQFSVDEQAAEVMPGQDETLTEADRLRLQTELLVQENLAAVQTGKKRLLAEMVPACFASMEAMISAMQILGLKYSLEAHEDIAQALRDYAAPKPDAGEVSPESVAAAAGN